MTVALKDDMFTEGDIVPSELLQSVVLTTAENTPGQDAKVQIEWNGQKTVKGDDNRDYSAPVSKPEYINEIPI